MSLKTKINSLVLFVFSLFFISLPNMALAQNSLGDHMKNILNKAAGPMGAGFNTDYGTGANLPLMIGGIIRVVLSFLGIIFFILIIYGGFLWMTAGGNKEQVSKAQDFIKNAAIGLVIVMIAYTIAHFIMVSIGEAGSSYGSSIP